MSSNPLSRKKAAVDRLVIEPDSASAAIPGVTTFLDPEPSQLAKKRSQALAGPRDRIASHSIHQESHWSLRPGRATCVPSRFIFAFFCSNALSQLRTDLLRVV